MTTNFSFSYEIGFLKNVISDFRKVFTMMPPGLMGKIRLFNVWPAVANALQVVEVDQIGTMVFLYVKVFGGPFPDRPTPEQQENINKVWTAMNLIHKVIPVQITDPELPYGWV
jgi:hypothetical protein